MSSRRAINRFIAWIACFAILVSGVASGLVHASPSPAADALFEICSATGSKWGKADSGASDSKSAPASKGVGKHCPACSLHHPALGLAHAPTISVVDLPLKDSLPELFLSAPQTLFAWRSAQPRAPPLC
jgi:hypothetical protein